MPSSSRSKSGRAKPSSNKVKRSRVKARTVSDFIDDMAEEDNGEMGGGGGDSSELSEVPDDAMENFIVPDNDGASEPEATESSNKQTINTSSDVESSAPIVPRTPKRNKKTLTPSVVGDTSGEEDITALDDDDSMFNKGSGIKASTLGPGLVTRSKRKQSRASSGSVEIIPNSSKKPKFGSPLADNDSEDFPDASQLLVLSPKTPSKPSTSKPSAKTSGRQKAASKDPGFDMKKYMAKYMAEQMPVLAQTVLEALAPAIESSVTQSAAILKEMKGIVAANVPVAGDTREVSVAVPVPDQVGATDDESQTVQRLDPSAMPGSPRKAGSADPVMDVEDGFASLSQKPKTGKGKERQVESPPPAVAGPLLNDMFAPETPKRKSTPKPSVQDKPVVEENRQEDEGGESEKVPSSSAAAKPGKDAPTPSISAQTKPALVLDSLFAAPEEVKKEEAPPVGLLKDAIPFEDKQVYLEDLETEKPVGYNPSAPCGVFDEEIQDPLLVPLYKGLPSLPGGRFVYPSFTQQSYMLEEGMKGGHMQFSAWGRILGRPSNCRQVTMESSLTFEQDGQYMNPVRCTPAIMQLKPTGPGSNAGMRVNIKGKVGICVSGGMLTECFLMEPQPSGSGSNARLRKVIALMLYNQDWERWESFMCTVFGEIFMFTPMSGMVLHIGSRLNDPNEKINAKNREDLDKSQDAFSPIRARTTSPSKRGPPGYFHNSSSIKYSYRHDDTIPVYDATNRDFNFKTDLPGMASNLPLWEGEIPVRSFVVAGYTAASYRGNGAGKPNQIHVGCNLMWAIVCGTPK